MKLRPRKIKAERMENRRRRITAAALEIPCPRNWCHAPAGSWCWQVPGVDVGMHDRRWAAAQDRIDGEDALAQLSLDERVRNGV